MLHKNTEEIQLLSIIPLGQGAQAFTQVGRSLRVPTWPTQQVPGRLARAIRELGESCPNKIKNKGQWMCLS